MNRVIIMAFLLTVSSSALAESIDKCVNLESPNDISMLVQELKIRNIPYRVSERTVCVGEASGRKLFAIVSELFSNRSKSKYLKTPQTPSGVAAESFNFYESMNQATLEASLRSKGIWFEKDGSGTM